MQFHKYDEDGEQFHIAMSADDIRAIREALGLAWNVGDQIDWSKAEELSSAKDLEKLLNAWERHAWNPTHAYPDLPENSDPAE